MMNISNIFTWLIETKIASNGFNAARICEGLKIGDLKTDSEIKARITLYRRWRPKTDTKNDISSKQAFDLAIAGIDPADIEPRQIEMELL